MLIGRGAIIIDWAHILAYITATLNEELVHGKFLSYASISSRNNLRETQRNATLPCNSLVGGLEKRQS
jgi:hypothetical protein